MIHLIAMCIVALQSWLPPSSYLESQRVDIEQREQGVCSDIVSVFHDPVDPEPPIYETPEQDVLQFAWLARLEGGMSPYVDDGRCNDPTWRRAHKKLIDSGVAGCDGGKAYSQWQIHTDGGIYLVPGGGYIAWPYAPKGSTYLHGRDLIADRKVAARAAIHIVRQSLADRGNLTGYTGERGERHPLADTRTNTPKAYAEKWLADRNLKIATLAIIGWPSRYSEVYDLAF